jgi:hypothetical protein
MTKDPIMIEPADASEEMWDTSRLRCGKIHSIEWNVKVRDIGMVSIRDKTKLLKYYKEGLNDGFDPDSDLDVNGMEIATLPHRSQQPSYPQQSQQPYYPNLQQPGYYPPQQQPYYQSQQAAYQQPLNGYSQQYPHMAPQQPPQNQHGNYSQHSSRPYEYPRQPPYQ